MKVVIPSSFFNMTEEQNIEFIKWQEFISENIGDNRIQDALLAYIQKLILNNTVVILDFNHLALLLGIKSNILSNMIMGSNSFYYNFEIPKRSGGTREIYAPYPVLLNAQRWIYENIIQSQPLHENSKGFKINTSIADNAKVHINQKVLLKMDIKDFFPSIKMNRIISIFRKLGYTKKISFYLASICCLDGVIPQGAATSPCLSNIIAKRLDYRLSGLAAKFNLAYTRYADDFTFSGDAIPVKVIDYVERIVKDEGFVINREKTRLIGEKQRKIVTGVSISSGKLTIPKEKKREVRKNIYYLLKNGLFEHQKQINSSDPIYVERLLGYLYFWLSIEPENEYVIKSIDKLKCYSNQLDLVQI